MRSRHWMRNSFVFGAWRTMIFLLLCLWSVNMAFATPSRQRLQILLNHYTSSLQAQQEALYNKSVKEEQSRRQTSAEVASGSLIQSAYSQFHQPPRTDNKYLDFQRTFYGSSEGVNYLKKHYGPNGLSQARADFGHNKSDVDDLTRANKHFLTIRNTVKCSQPRPKVVRVKDYYPDPTKQYLPECTILHRCADSGCCEHEGLECVPRAVQEVDLFFYTIFFGSKGKDFGQVEKLLFTNHTECECQPVNDLPRTAEETVEQPPSPPKTHSHNPALHHPGLQPPPHQTNPRCRDCPVPFYIREYPDGRCACDCFDKQKPCLRIKRGREALPDIEKRCIDARHCQIPDCEFGLYEHSSGRCPKRPSELHNRNDHRLHSQHHRWSAWERD